MAIHIDDYIFGCGSWEFNAQISIEKSSKCDWVLSLSYTLIVNDCFNFVFSYSKKAGAKVQPLGRLAK